MQNILHKDFESELRIRLLNDSPLAELNDELPNGIPVLGSPICFSGNDCYCLSFEDAAEEGIARRIASALAGSGTAQLFSYAVSQYKLVPIPCEWAIEVQGGQW